MNKLYKLFVLLLIITAMNTTVQAQDHKNSGSSPVNNSFGQDVAFSNYPNPATSQTKISYTLKSKSKVNLRVVDLTGRQLAVFVNNDQLSGKQEFNWDFSKYKVTSGMYILILRIDNKTYSRKVIVQ